MINLVVASFWPIVHVQNVVLCTNYYFLVSMYVLLKYLVLYIHVF